MDISQPLSPDWSLLSAHAQEPPASVSSAKPSRDTGQFRITRKIFLQSGQTWVVRKLHCFKLRDLGRRVTRGKDLRPDHHLIILPKEASRDPVGSSSVRPKRIGSWSTSRIYLPLVVFSRQAARLTRGYLASVFSSVADLRGSKKSKYQIERQAIRQTNKKRGQHTKTNQNPWEENLRFPTKTHTRRLQTDWRDILAMTTISGSSPIWHIELPPEG
ncbi:hypothetical protein RRG08_040205 [Elysia crispata]|uniref:Uncharacterized protein n=1 Tax=Elysia crispata TaxID=231223 RepID=A0AAE0XXP5_9GAST|nr:hypothetical protein RRG08_040205 [Elysia crispata]